MSHASRRLWLYGLPLFISAVVVGGLALGLLAREQTRLAEREALAYESRRAAVEARVRLIAENIELLVTDVQTTLMTGLLGVPEVDARDFMDGWRAANPLIREVFATEDDGTLRWGGDSPATRRWLGTQPWAAAARPFLAAPLSEPSAATDASVDIHGRSQVLSETLSNAAQYQRARQDVMRLASRLPERAETYAAKRVPEVVASVPSSSFLASSTVSGPAPAPATAMISADATALTAGSGSTGERAGWLSWRDGPDRLHVFAWRTLDTGGRIGLELDLDALKPRFRELFPEAEETVRYSFAEEPVGEGRGTRIQVPIAEPLLPGWRVVGELAEGPVASTGIFAPGAAIITLLVLAIVVAGVALLRQARRSELEAAMKTSFVANVSHELKTPLTTIRLYAELLAQGRVHDERKQADYLAVIGEEAQRLARLVGNVLDFSRLEQGAKRYERTEFDLVAELRALAEAHGPRLAAAGVAAHIHAPATLSVLSDRDAVVQVLLNLLDNACKYAAAGGEVTLTIENDAASGARVLVADRGPGVPESQHERIFEKFHRVDERLTAEKGGAGLGLSIARRLARGLGGELTCRARAGGGAEFVFTLGPGHP